MLAGGRGGGRTVTARPPAIFTLESNLNWPFYTAAAELGKNGSTKNGGQNCSSEQGEPLCVNDLTAAQPADLPCHCCRHCHCSSYSEESHCDCFKINLNLTFEVYTLIKVRLNFHPLSSLLAGAVWLSVTVRGWLLLVFGWLYYCHPYVLTLLMPRHVRTKTRIFCMTTSKSRSPTGEHD